MIQGSGRCATSICSSARLTPEVRTTSDALRIQASGGRPPRHHHLQGMAKTLEGATVTIELHHELLPRTPFIEPCSYDDLLRRSQPFEWSGNMYRTLGREDMLWHVTRRVPAPALGAECGTTPLPIGLVLVTSYRAGARWRPRRLTPAPTLLALMRHTVAARGNPAHSMPILKQAVSGGMAFASRRGEGPPLVSTVLRHVRMSMPSASPRQGAI